MTTKHFTDYLKDTAALVSTWPLWKQNILGKLDVAENQVQDAVEVDNIQTKEKE